MLPAGPAFVVGSRATLLGTALGVAAPSVTSWVVGGWAVPNGRAGLGFRRDSGSPYPRPARLCDDRLMATSVLVVDDDPSFLSLAMRVLDGIGVEVVATAEDAAAGIAAANATRPEAVLVDVGLPDRDGIDLASELVALPWRPRVVLTSTDRDAVNAIDARDGDREIPFVPKEELASEPLRRLLLGH
jgi:CheY-like chemotaxis protein